MKRDLESAQSRKAAGLRSGKPQFINTSHKPDKNKAYPSDLSAEISSFSPHKVSQRHFLSPQSINSFDIDLFNDSFKEKPTSQETKIRMLELTIDQNRVAYENEKKVMSEYIELLKRKLQVLTNEDGKTSENTYDLTSDNLKLRAEITKLNSVISDKEIRVRTLCEEIQAKNLEIMQMSKKISSMENLQQNLVSESEKMLISKSHDDLQIKLKLENISLMEQLAERNKEMQLLKAEKKQYELDTKAISYKQLTVDLKEKIIKNLEKYEREFAKVREWVERIDNRLALSTKSIRFLQNNTLTETCKNKSVEKDLTDKIENLTKTIISRDETINTQSETISSLNEKILTLNTKLSEKIQTYQKILSEEHSKIDKLKEEVFESSIALDGQKSRFEEIIKQKDQDITILVAKGEEDIKKLDDQISSLKISLLELSKENFRLNKELVKKENDYQAIFEEANITDEKICQLENENKVLEMQVSDFEKKHEAVYKDVINNKKILEEKEKLLNKLEADLSEKTRNFKEVNDKLLNKKIKSKEMKEFSEEREKSLQGYTLKIESQMVELVEKESMIVILQDNIDEMKNKIKDLEETVERVSNKAEEEFKCQKNNYDFELKEKARVVENQKRNIQQLEEDMEKCSNDLNEAKDSLAKKEKDINDLLENSIIQKNFEVEECRKSHMVIISEKETEIENLKEALASAEKLYKYQIESLQKSLAEAESYKKTSSKDKEKLSLDLIQSLKEQYNEEILTLRENLKKTEQNYQAEIFRLEGQFSIKLDKMKQEENLKCCKLNMEKGVLDKEIQLKNEKIEEMILEIEGIKEELSNTQTENNANIEVVKKLYDNLLNKIEAHLQNTWEDLKNKEFPKSDVEISDPSHANIAKEIFQYIHGLDSAIKYLENELDILRLFETQIIEKRSETEELEKRIKVLLNENAQIKHQDEKNKKILERKNTNMEKQSNKLDEMYTKITDYENKIFKKKEKSKEKKDKIFKLRADNEELMKKIEDYEKIVKELDEGIALNEEKRKEVEDSLQKQINLAKSEIKRLASLDKANQEELQSLQEKTSQMEETIVILENDVNIRKEENDSMKKHISELEEKERAAYAEEIKQYKLQTKELERSLQALTSKITDLQQQKEKDDGIIKKLRDNKAQQNYATTIKNLEDQLKDKENECLSLQKTNETLQQGSVKLISVKDGIQNMFKEIQEHEQMFKELRELNIHTFEGRQVLKNLRDKSEVQENNSRALFEMITELIESLR